MDCFLYDNGHLYDNGPRLEKVKIHFLLITYKSMKIVIFELVFVLYFLK